jgi:hypothetical protein
VSADGCLLRWLDMATLRTFVAEQRCRSAIVPGQECTRRDAFCQSLANVFSPYTAGFSGRVVRVRRDGKKEAVARNLPSMTTTPAG